jgi:hypothetical protein
MTPTEFATKHGITMTCTHADKNPAMPSFEGDHWKCRLKRGKKSMTLIFSKGVGHHGAPPTVGEVLECLSADASYENLDFTDWAAEMGYDDDETKVAEKSYKAIVRQTSKLKNLLGEDFEKLLDVEE